MPLPALSSALSRASDLLKSSGDTELTDGRLLTQFILSRDDGAFAELVRRLGPRVLGVCRRITGDVQLAEDAFQAVFIVLVRRAHDVRPREGVRGWLYGVAVRTAKRARAMSIHRRAREAAVPILPERAVESPEPPDIDALRILDEEVGALPEHLRAAVVLCELESVSRKDAAQKLGISEGTLSSRLAAARKRLARRLCKRGIVLSATAMTAAFQQLANAQPSMALMTQAAQAATRETIPAHLASLTNGVLRIMFLDKLKTSFLAVLTVTGLLACVAMAALPPTEPPIPPRIPTNVSLVHNAKQIDPTPAQKDTKPLPKGPNKLVFYQSGSLNSIDPDGKNESKLLDKPDGIILMPAPLKLSPDGKLLAFSVIEPKGERGKGPAPVTNGKLHVRELTEKGLGTDLDLNCRAFTWSPDGRQIAASDWIEGADKQRVSTHYLVDVKTKEKKPLKLPDNHVIMDWTPDGKYLLTYSLVLKDEVRSSRIHLMNLDGTEHKALTDEKANVSGGRISPDGTRVLCSVQKPVERKEKTDVKGKQPLPRSEMHVLHIDSGKLTPVADVAENGTLLSSCWSQDGKQIAYVWRQRPEIKDGDKPVDIMMKEVEIHIMVCDEDGKNHKSLYSTKAKNGPIVMGGLDWR